MHMNNLILEIDEELRARQLKALWAKYGQTLIGTAILIVFGVAAGVFWHNAKVSTLTAQTGDLLAALQVEDRKVMADAVENSDAPLKTVALFYAAQSDEAAKNIAAAEMNYKKASETARDPIWRDLAVLHVVRLGLVQNKDAKPLIERVDPLTREGAPFRSSALEMKALLLQKIGKKDEANAILESLATDGTAPNTLRQRARALKE
jgi:hypothetical protein